jgi:hypothetical protein
VVGLFAESAATILVVQSMVRVVAVAVVAMMSSDPDLFGGYHYY